MAQYRDDFRMVDAAGQIVVMNVPSTQALTLSHGMVIGGSRQPIKNGDLATKSYVDRNFLANPKTDLDAHSSNIFGLPPAPIDPGDAASKTYVTGSVSKYSVGKYSYGGKIIRNVGTPTQDTDLATKAYVTGASYDQLGGSKIVQVGTPLASGDMATMEYAQKKKDFLSDLDLHSNQIKNLAAAVLPRDAITKSQLDAIVALYASVLAVKSLDMDGHQLQNVGDIPLPTGPQPSDLVNLGSMRKYLQKFWVDLHEMGGREVLNVGAPTADDSMANRDYVSTTVASKTANDQGMGRIVNLGATGTITQDTNLASKKLVDDDLSASNVALFAKATNDMGTQRVINVQDATFPNQMVTKGQIDTTISAIDFKDMQNRKITNVGDPSAGTDMVNLEYVEREAAQNIWGNANSNRVTNVGNPIDPTDAVNQKTLAATIAAAKTNDMHNQRVTNLAEGTNPSDGVSQSQAKMALAPLQTSGIDGGGVTRTVSTTDQKLASKSDLEKLPKPSAQYGKNDAIVDRQISKVLGNLETIFAFSTALHPPISLSYGKASAGTATSADFSTFKANASHLFPLLTKLGSNETISFPILPPSLASPSTPHVLVWIGSFLNGLPNTYVKVLDTYFEYADSSTQIDELKLTLSYNGTDRKFAVTVTRFGRSSSVTRYTSNQIRYPGSAASIVAFDISDIRRTFIANNGRSATTFRVDSTGTASIPSTATKNTMVLHGHDPGMNHAFAAFTTSNPIWLEKYLTVLKIS